MYFETFVKDISEKVKNDLKDHAITLLHSDGLYRHWKCSRPSSWVYGFNIVTWPGYLCFCGDMGEYVFARTSDMVEFMQGACRSYDYAAQKCVASCRDGIYQWSPEIFQEKLHAYLKDYPENEEKVNDIRETYENTSSPEQAKQAMYDSDLWDEIPNCEALTFRFIWCLHALQWAFDKINDGCVVTLNSRD